MNGLIGIFLLSPKVLFFGVSGGGGEVWNGIPFNGPHLSVLPVVSTRAASSFFLVWRKKRGEIGAGEGRLHLLIR